MPSVRESRFRLIPLGAARAFGRGGHAARLAPASICEALLAYNSLWRETGGLRWRSPGAKAPSCRSLTSPAPRSIRRPLRSWPSTSSSGRASGRYFESEADSPRRLLPSSDKRLFHLDRRRPPGKSPNDSLFQHSQFGEPCGEEQSCHWIRQQLILKLSPNFLEKDRELRVNSNQDEPRWGASS